MKAEMPQRDAYDLAVVDTNVLLSAALLRESIPARVVDHILAHGCLVFSDKTFTEFESRIWKPKFDRYLSLEARRSLLKDFNAAAIWIEIPTAIALRTYSRDNSDDVFVHTAIASGATRLISGDTDLLILGSVAEVRIISPADAWLEIAR